MDVVILVYIVLFKNNKKITVLCKYDLFKKTRLINLFRIGSECVKQQIIGTLYKVNNFKINYTKKLMLMDIGYTWKY